MTGEEEKVFIYELYVKMYRVDVLEMMDPHSQSNMKANSLLNSCDNEMLMAIYKARVPWLAARAFGIIMQRQQANYAKESRE